MDNEKNQGLQKDAKQVEKEAAEKIGKAVVSKEELGLQIQNSMKQIKKRNTTTKIKKAAVSNKAKTQKNKGEEKKMVETEEEKIEEVAAPELVMPKEKSADSNKSLLSLEAKETVVQFISSSFGAVDLHIEEQIQQNIDWFLKKQGKQGNAKILELW